MILSQTFLNSIYILKINYPILLTWYFSLLLVSLIDKNKIWLVYYLLIHSANPQSWPVGIIVFAHVVRTSVRPSPLFKSRKTKQQKTTFATGVTMGLAEWIIDDNCLVSQLFLAHPEGDRRFSFAKLDEIWNLDISLSRLSALSTWRSSGVSIFNSTSCCSLLTSSEITKLTCLSWPWHLWSSSSAYNWPLPMARSLVPWSICWIWATWFWFSWWAWTLIWGFSA